MFYYKGFRESILDQFSKKFVVFKCHFSEENDFINFWKRLYKYSEPELYNENIYVKEKSDQTLLNLFQWKNGRKLSTKKMKSITNNYFQYKEKFPLHPNEDFISSELKKPGGAIWRIFWLHCNYPNLLPMYDQHVHRAMGFSINLDNFEIPKTDSEKVGSYLTVYRPFVSHFKNFGFSLKEIDMALFAFGKFIKDEKRRELVKKT